MLAPRNYVGTTHTPPPAPLPLAALPPDPLPTLRAERPTWAAARRAAPRVPWAAATKSSSVVRKGTPTGERGRSDWVAGLPGAEGRGLSALSNLPKKKKKTTTQVVQRAPEENQVREVPEAAEASSTTTASGVRLVREAGLVWRGPQHTLVPS